VIRRGRLAGLLAALGATAGLGCASGAPPHLEDPPELRALSLVRTLPSGLRLIVGHDRRQSVASVSLVVGAGSANDPPGKAGLAHLVEHLTYRASAGDAIPRDRRLDALGTDYQGETSLDLTNFRSFAFHGFWRELVRAEVGRLGDPLADLDPEVFRRELDVVRSELWQREETHGSARGLGWLQEQLFEADDPYAHGPGGTLESLATLTLDDARAFTQHYYLPENATLYVDGGMSAEVEREIDAALGELGGPGGAAPARSPTFTAIGGRARTKPPTPLRVARYPSRVPSPELWMGWVLPSAFSSDGALVSLVHSLARAELATDRLFADADGVTKVSVSLGRGTRVSILVCHADLLASADPVGVARQIADHVSSLWASQMPQAATLQQRRNIVHNATLFADEGLRARTAARPAFAHVTRDPRFVVHNLAETMASLDRFDAGDFMRAYLSPNQARAIYLEPSAQGRGQTGPMDKAPAGPATPAPPLAFGKVQPDALRSWTSELRTKTLRNGLTAIVAPRGGVAASTVLIGFHEGTETARPRGAAEISAVAGVTSMTDMLCGTLARCGVVSTGAWPDADATSQSWAMDPTLVKHTLEIVAETQELAWIEWPKGERGHRYRDWEAAQFGRPEIASSGTLFEALYPGRAWGRVVAPRELDAVDKKAVEQWTERHRSARNAVVIVVGDVNAEETLATIEDEFGGWSAGEPTPVPEAPPLVERPRPAITTTPWPGSPQAQVQFACRLPPSAGRWSDLLASRIAATLDGALRRREGVTYGFSSGSHAYRGGTTDVVVSGLVANGALPGALQEIEAIVDQLGVGHWPVPEEELAPSHDTSTTPTEHELWRNLTASALLVDTNADVARRLLWQWNLGLPFTDEAGTAAWLKTIDGANAEPLLRTCKNTTVVAIAAPPQALTGDLRAGSLPPASPALMTPPTPGTQP
jgi:zinc protease